MRRLVSLLLLSLAPLLALAQAPAGMRELPLGRGDAFLPIYVAGNPQAQATVILLPGGDAGTGKSRLAQECLRAAELASTRKLHTPIHLAFSYDEEIGCVGVRRMLDILKDAPVKPRLCIVGEPTLMQAVTAHKGKLGFRVTAHGLEAHSSLAPIGVNAIYMASDLIGAIRVIQKDIAENGVRDGD